MARNQQKKQQRITEIESEQSIGKYEPAEKAPFSESSKRSNAKTIKPDREENIALHSTDEETADHYGSREETQAALEGKIASQNTLKLHGHF